MRDTRFELRVTAEQLERWRTAAATVGRSVGDWLARVGDHAASSSEITTRARIEEELRTQDCLKALVGTSEADGKKYYEGWIDKIGGVGRSFVVVRAGSAAAGKRYTIALADVRILETDSVAIADAKLGLENAGYRSGL